MLSLNLFAQPGAGKSTTAATVFAHLKNRGCNVELVNEFAKQLVYSGRQGEMRNQVYMLAKQYKKMEDLDSYKHVPMIVTDSPLLIGLMYSQSLFYYKELEALTRALFNSPSFENINVLVNRVKPYNPSGRNQTEAESDALIEKVKSLGVHFHYVINGDEEGQRGLADIIYKTYGDRLKIKPESPLQRLRKLGKVKPQNQTTVQIVESERGWGQKVDEELLFDKREDAKAFVDAFNDSQPQTTDGSAPDFYVYARLA